MTFDEMALRRPEWNKGEPVELAGQTWYLPNFGPRQWFALMEATDPAAATALKSGDPLLIADSMRRALAAALLTNYVLSPFDLGELLPVTNPDLLGTVRNKLALVIGDATSRN